MANTIQKITTFLWFDDNAEEAVNFYISIFKNSKILQTARYGKGMPGKAGTIMTIKFLLEGQEFIALNGGPIFKFTEAISLMVACDTQKEIDELWEKLCKGGEESQCGWLKDKFGLSWQIVPADIAEMISEKNPEKSQRVMEEVMKMKKLDINIMRKAYAE